MDSDLRAVIDTGVVVSAVLLPRSVPRQAFDPAATRGRLLVSDETIAELDGSEREPHWSTPWGSPPHVHKATISGVRSVCPVGKNTHGFDFRLRRQEKTAMKFTRITHSPAVMGGKPCIRGLRVTVGTVVGLLAAGESRERILAAYPYLEPADLDEALAYAAWRLEEREEELLVPT